VPEIGIQTAGGTRERYPLAKPRVTVGRSRENDIFLPEATGRRTRNECTIGGTEGAR